MVTATGLRVECLKHHKHLCDNHKHHNLLGDNHKHHKHIGHSMQGQFLPGMKMLKACWETRRQWLLLAEVETVQPASFVMVEL